MTDKPWSKELGLMFVALCEGLGLVPPQTLACLRVGGASAGILLDWTLLLNYLAGYPNVHGPWIYPSLLACGPAPSQKLDIQTAALVQYLGEALGWPQLDW